MLKKIGLVDLQGAMQKQIADLTKYPCYDVAPDNVPAPFYFIEIVGKRDASTKTSYQEVYTMWVHAIAEARKSKVQVYEMVQALEEAMTELIKLPEGYQLLMQTAQGMQTLKVDETDEYHAVVVFELTVLYGYKYKI